MVEPFSIDAGNSGILAPALHWTRLLLDDLQKVSDAPTVVQALRADLLSVKMTLESLQAVTEQEWDLLGPNVVERSKITISTDYKGRRGGI